MLRKKLLSTLAALGVAAGVLAAPVSADARDHRRDWRGDGYHYNYDRNRYYGHRHKDNDGDALAAGIFGLAIGAVLGAALTSDPEPRYGPSYSQGYYPPAPPPQPYYGSGYDPYYGPPQGQCFRREIVWDPNTRRNIEVTHPYPC